MAVNDANQQTAIRDYKSIYKSEIEKNLADGMTYAEAKKAAQETAIERIEDVYDIDKDEFEREVIGTWKSDDSGEYSDIDSEIDNWAKTEGLVDASDVPSTASEKIAEAKSEARENNYSDEEYRKVRNQKFGDYDSDTNMQDADLSASDKAELAADEEYTDDAAGLAEMLNDQNVADYEKQMNAALEGLQEAYDNGNDTTTLLGDYEQNVNDILAGMDSTENAAFNYGDYQNGLSSKVAEEVARSVGDTKLSNTTYDATRGTTAANYNNAVNQAISAANVANQGYKNMADLNQNTTNTAKTVADDLTAYKADMADSEYNAANSLRRSALNGYEEDDPLEKANDVTKAVSSGLDAAGSFISLFADD